MPHERTMVMIPAVVIMVKGGLGYKLLLTVMELGGGTDDDYHEERDNGCPCQREDGTGFHLNNIGDVDAGLAEDVLVNPCRDDGEHEERSYPADDEPDGARQGEL